ncbi:hypothetical protein R3P38DRAFT_3245417 [Favolaschia claudopus]|uniref:Uncharacterized protein n=1 Tax=Favolaschia claudopus TaxID=2862362 RepID=A0AAV9Z0H3_9AGAR
MGAPPWTTPLELEYLNSMLPAYVEARKNAHVVPFNRFWTTLNSGFLSRFPVEGKLGIPNGPLARRLKLKLKRRTSARSLPKGKASERATKAGKKKAGKGLFKILGKKKKPRPYRSIEIYQKLYCKKIRAAVMDKGYGQMNEEAEAERAAAAAADGGSTQSSRVLTEDELAVEEARIEAETDARIRAHASQRFSLMRTTSIAMLSTETPEVKAHVESEKEERNAIRMQGWDDARNSTDSRCRRDCRESYRRGSGVVYARGERWSDPGRAGALSMKTICYGTIGDGGPDFLASYPELQSLKAHFAKFLKRAFPHDVRDARSLPELIARDGDEGDSENEQPEDSPAPAPKRIRRKQKKTSTASETITYCQLSFYERRTCSRDKYHGLPATPTTSAPSPAGLTPSLTPTTPPQPVSANDYPIPPDFDQTLQDIIVHAGALHDDGLISMHDGLMPMHDDDDDSSYSFRHSFGDAWSDGTPDFIPQPPSFDAAGNDLPEPVAARIRERPVARPAPPPFFPFPKPAAPNTTGVLSFSHIPASSVIPAATPSTGAAAAKLAALRASISNARAKVAESNEFATFNLSTAHTSPPPLVSGQPPASASPHPPIIPTPPFNPVASNIVTPVVPIDDEEPPVAPAPAVDAAHAGRGWDVGRARAESARIHREEAEQRKNRNEALRREKAMRENVAEVESGRKKRVARANAASEGEVFVVRPLQELRERAATKQMFYPDGREMHLPGMRASTRGSFPLGPRAGTLADLNPAQKVHDEDLLHKLQGTKRKAAEDEQAKKPSK